MKRNIAFKKVDDFIAEVKHQLNIDIKAVPTLGYRLKRYMFYIEIPMHKELIVKSFLLKYHKNIWLEEHLHNRYCVHQG